MSDEHKHHEHEHDREHNHHEHAHHHHHGLDHDSELPCDGDGHEHHHHEDGSCCCHHHEVEYHGISKLFIARLVISVLLYLCVVIVPFEETAETIILLAAGIIAGYDVIWSAFRNLVKGKFFDEYFLMTVAAIAACIIGEVEEGAAVMVLYRIGQTCQDVAISHSRKRLVAVAGDSAPDTACGGRTESFITAFSRIYTPVILVLSLLIAVLMPLLVRGMGYSDSVYRALTTLVIACPCSIVISVPMAYFAGISAGSASGIFFHDSTAVDALARGELDTHAHEGRIEAPGLVIMDETDLDKARRIAAKARRVAMQNVIIVVACKLIVLVNSFLGIPMLWFAVFADSGVTVIAVLNSLRAFRVK